MFCGSICLRKNKVTKNLPEVNQDRLLIDINQEVIAKFERTLYKEKKLYNELLALLKTAKIDFLK